MLLTSIQRRLKNKYRIKSTLGKANRIKSTWFWLTEGQTLTSKKLPTITYSNTDMEITKLHYLSRSLSSEALLMENGIKRVHFLYKASC